MRFLFETHDQDEVKKVVSLFSSKDIETEVDGGVGKDWGSEDYGAILYKVWVIDEDRFDEARDLFHAYLRGEVQAPKRVTPPRLEVIEPQRAERKTPLTPTVSLTNQLILICCLLFLWGAFTNPEYKVPDSNVQASPVYASPTKEALLYDFPKAYEILNQLVSKYGMEGLKDNEELPSQGQELVRQFEATPYWQGVYDIALDKLSGKEGPKSAPLFEKIRQGEIWRIFTPIFLHGDIFHLLFNMIWLYVLGKQLEAHMGKLRFIAFIAVGAAITNTAQYLMSGPNFIGFSGVLCAMLTYIWLRQKEAPWEGYQMQRNTFVFMMIFIFGMFALQAIAFILEVFAGTQIPTSIANTAHIAGIFLGLILAKIPFFTHERISRS